MALACAIELRRCEWRENVNRASHHIATASIGNICLSLFGFPVFIFFFFSSRYRRWWYVKHNILCQQTQPHKSSPISISLCQNYKSKNTFRLSAFSFLISDGGMHSRQHSTTSPRSSPSLLKIIARPRVVPLVVPEKNLFLHFSGSMRLLRRLLEGSKLRRHTLRWARPMFTNDEGLLNVKKFSQ